MKKLLTLFIFSMVAMQSMANDGHQLWLQYPDNVKVSNKVQGSAGATSAAGIELLMHYQGSKPVKLTLKKKAQMGDGYDIQVTDKRITITASNENGLLYGAYDLLRMQQLGRIEPRSERPAFDLRLLNHWDNLDGSIERGYAGKSIWKWEEINGDAKPGRHYLDEAMSQSLYKRVVLYARANASLGINGTVINNVNASPKILSTEYLKKIKVISNILSSYGIKVYLSINFASPMALGDTETADPLDPQVIAWWKNKAKEIYTLIPNFGGFLVKANSEGQPGPGDYKRSHADGANMLADALKPYKGIVMWRCFVYGANHKGEDRVKQAVSEFKPLDGQFRDNVILQTKNGPLDFQPREPYSPIFDQIQHTPNMAELQITQEYLGQSRHLVYLAPMWKEFFSYVAPDKLKGIAGVANIGDDANWCGHHFSQANWYAFGRLAWNPELTSEEIAREWIELTFAKEDTFVNTMTDLMLGSREACVDYMMPLGLHHIFKFDHHYGPEPDGFKAQYPLEWCPVYYHKADEQGVGFDRSSTGSNAVAQYREPYATIYNKVETCPEKYLLWFHHVPWDYKMKSGHTLWQELVSHYNHGVRVVESYPEIWQQMKKTVLTIDNDDSQRWQEVYDRLLHQVDNAREWRDVCLKYFQTFSKMPIQE